ncbi:TPA: hypothetical protein ACGXRC_002569, partial [Listeria monocytogenes]
FKYNFDNQANLITIIGKVTGKFERLIDEKYFRDQDLNQYPQALNETFKEFVKLVDFISNEDYIISPVALYFDDDLI